MVILSTDLIQRSDSMQFLLRQASEVYDRPKFDFFFKPGYIPCRHMMHFTAAEYAPPGNFTTVSIPVTAKVTEI